METLIAQAAPALIGGLFGVIGTVTTLFFGTKNKRIEVGATLRGKEIDDRAAFRKELMVEIEKQNARIDHLSNELDTWRAKYFELFADYTTLKSAYEELKRRAEKMEGDLKTFRASAFKERRGIP